MAPVTLRGAQNRRNPPSPLAARSTTPPLAPADSQLAFRAVAVKERRLDADLIARRLERAAALRQRLFEGQDTTGAARAARGTLQTLPAS